MGEEITGKVKLPPIGQIGIVVKDLDKVLDFYQNTFGIGPWAVREGEYKALRVRDKIYPCKTKVACTNYGSIELELFQVREGHSLHSEFLDQGREGLHHLGFYVSREEKEKILADLAKEGIGVVQGADMPKVSYAYVDTDKIGGVFFEFIEKRSE